MSGFYTAQRISGNAVFGPQTDFGFAVPPDEPPAVVASPGNASALVIVIPPVFNGGSFITLYEVTSSPGGFVITHASPTFAFTTLTNNVPYTFTARAFNSAGWSDVSIASNSVTPLDTLPVVSIITPGSRLMHIGWIVDQAGYVIGYRNPVTEDDMNLAGVLTTQQGSITRIGWLIDALGHVIGYRNVVTQTDIPQGVGARIGEVGWIVDEDGIVVGYRNEILREDVSFFEVAALLP